MKAFFSRLSLAEQFLLVSFPILLGGTLFIGKWIGDQVEESVTHRIGGMTALYVDSFVAQHVQTLVDADTLTQADRSALAALLTDTPLGHRILTLNIWRPDGHVLFSSDPGVEGQTFPVNEGLAAALTGRIFSEVSERDAAEIAMHRQPRSRVIEMYSPIHSERLGRIIAVAEFYQAPDEVDREAWIVQRRSWLVLTGVMTAMYLLLSLVVGRGSRTISRQRQDLSDKVDQLTALNRQNSLLHERVRRAAARTTEQNERFLQNISADIHDGAGQDLGFALMRLKSVGDVCVREGAPSGCVLEHVLPARTAVQSALTDLRAISANLKLPDIQHLTLVEIAARAVSGYEQKTATKVTLVNALPELSPPITVKITLYRFLQESLANTFHHAHCENCRVELKGDAQSLTVQVTDDGAGFDPKAALRKGRLGLSGMRERVEILGGTFQLDSVLGKGTTIRVTLPMIPQAGGEDD
jgi:signal transduction histidine kinase